MIKFKDIVVDTIFNLDINLSKDEIKELIETPPNPEMGDYSFPCFKLSKELRKAPNIIAQELVNRINIEDSVFFKISNVGPYINFFIKPTEYFSNVISEMILRKYDYGSSKNNLDKTIVIDYSSTNIAKPFHIGHIRSTLIGNVIKNIYKFLGYNTIGVNHLGDYGTQFGKIIAAYKLWGNKEEINAVYEDLRDRRNSKQPLNFGSAGSTFKRPEGHFASKLIEDAGLKGYHINDAWVSEKHSGFIVNKGNASYKEVMELIEYVQKVVFEKFEVKLETEVRILKD